MRSPLVLAGLIAASGALVGTAAQSSAPPSAPGSAVTQNAWDHGAVNTFPIHPSCNATETSQLRKALADTVRLAEHAKQHVLRYGNTSEHYRRYFGTGGTGEVIGWFEKVVSADRGRTLFRCDDPDDNCRLDGWGGHWRGSNATDETVICPLSYSTRLDLEQLCAFGYNVAEGATNTYFASDLLHRLYHMPAIGEGLVEHYSEGEEYADILELARNNATIAVRDSDALQYFALDVYAHDIAVPGIGCSGPRPQMQVSSAIASTTMASAAAATTSAQTTLVTVAATTMPSRAPLSSDTSTLTTQVSAPAASALPENCHTHAGGELHCV